MYIQAMNFEWDLGKSVRNRKKHKIGFETAVLVFEDPYHLTLQDRTIKGEQRYHTLGLAHEAVLILVVHTFHMAPDTEIIRIISARKATKKEVEAYEERRRQS
jgi:hypothetical protein